MHEVELQLGFIGLVVYALRWAQRSALFPGFRIDTEKVRMGLSAMFAFLTAIGFVFSFDGYSVLQGGKIVIMVPSLDAIATALGHGSLGFMGQELGHTLLKVRDSQTTISGLLLNLQKNEWMFNPDNSKFKVTADLIPPTPKQTAEPIKEAAVAADTPKHDG